MTNVVFDTNVVMSALLFGGTPGAAFDCATEKGFQLHTEEVLNAS